MDPANPIVALCAEGMKAESEHRFGDAAALFLRAWRDHQTDYEASVAAHFVARQQSDLEEALRWNQLALDHALAAPLDEVHAFLPSLYLNLAQSHALLSSFEEARKCLALGEHFLPAVDDGAYGEMLRDGFARARLRFEAGSVG